MKNVENIPIKEYDGREEILLKRRKSMNYLTTVEMAKIWGISSRRISLLCSQNRIVGAVKKGKTWLIPNDSKKPIDPRREKKMENNMEL